MKKNRGCLIKGLSFVGVLLFLFAVRVRAEEQASIPGGRIRGFSFVIAGEKGDRKTLIQGDVAHMLEGGKVEITNVRTKVFKHKEKDAEITSPKGVFNRISKQVTTEEPVRIVTKDFILTGKGLLWKPHLERLTLKKDVRMEIMQKLGEVGEKSETQSKEKGTASPETIITCEGKLFANYRESVCDFHKNVVVVDEGGTLHADHLTVFFDQESREIDRVEAIGNVRIRQPERNSKSERAIYFAEGDKVILLGNPVIQQGSNIYGAQKITLFRREERVVFEPKAKLILYETKDKF